MTNLCICIYRWWILHGGNVTVSYSHPLWHIPTRWQYDWWELAGRMMMMMRASMRRQIFVKKHTLAKLLWTSGVTCCFAKQQHSNVFLLVSLCLNENIALAVSVRSTREYYTSVNLAKLSAEKVAWKPTCWKHVVWQTWSRSRRRRCRAFPSKVGNCTLQRSLAMGLGKA